MHNAPANPDDGYLQQKMVDAIANLATSTASERAAIAQLTDTVARLALETNHSSRSSRGGRGRNNRGQGKGNGAVAPARTGAGAPTMAEENDLETPIHYCWTCGPGFRHNSAKCPAPSTGHIYMATKRNMQWGEEATK